MRIGRVNLTEKVLVIAEIGNNHEGRFSLACELVDRAADCGVDAVKFQTFQTRLFVSPRERARYETLRSFELTYPQFEELGRRVRDRGLVFISTPLDLPSARFLGPLVDCYKIASGDNNFYPLMAEIAGIGKPAILSSGMADLGQLEKSKAFLEAEYGRRGHVPQIAVLHCVSSYPAPVQELNLAAIRVIGEALGCPVGYSDHCLGIEAAVLSVAAGARIVEKHFTLDKNLSSFRDHQLSADPEEMKRLAEQVARVSLMLGRPEKAVQPSEAAVIPVARRSIAAAADLPQGHRLGAEDFVWLRPGDGLPPGDEGRLVGRTLKRALAAGDPIVPSDVS